MATMDDIAKALGVAKSTVSKAINGAGDVSESMRRAVLETAVELGYTRLRRSEDAPRLAVFVADMRYEQPEHFGYDIIVGFRKIAEPEGYAVHIIPVNFAMQSDIHYDEYMMRENYRGGFLLGFSLKDPWMRDFKTCKTPAVLYDNRVTGNPLVTYVGADTAEGMGLAVGYLKRLGHQKIGYLGGDLGSYVYQQRYQAFFDALREEKLPSEECLAGCAYLEQVCLEEHLPRLLQQQCTAIVCSHDTLAEAVINRCHRLGVKIPEQVSVVGFDDLPLCAHTRPPLTTIRQNRTELGKSAYCALSSQLEGVPLSTFLLHTELVKRGSCAAVTEKETQE